MIVEDSFHCFSFVSTLSRRSPSMQRASRSLIAFAVFTFQLMRQLNVSFHVFTRRSVDHLLLLRRRRSCACFTRRSWLWQPPRFLLLRHFFISQFFGFWVGRDAYNAMVHQSNVSKAVSGSSNSSKVKVFELSRLVHAFFTLLSFLQSFGSWHSQFPLIFTGLTTMTSFWTDLKDEFTLEKMFSFVVDFKQWLFTLQKYLFTG